MNYFHFAITSSENLPTVENRSTFTVPKDNGTKKKYIIVKPITHSPLCSEPY